MKKAARRSSLAAFVGRIGGGRLTMCRLASRACEHSCGLLRACGRLFEIFEQLPMNARRLAAHHFRWRSRSTTSPTGVTLPSATCSSPCRMSAPRTSFSAVTTSAPHRGQEKCPSCRSVKCSPLSLISRDSKSCVIKNPSDVTSSISPHDAQVSNSRSSVNRPSSPA